MQALLAESARILAASHQEAQRTAEAYGIQLAPPVELPPPAWAEAARKAEQRHGCRIVKFFRNEE